MKRETFFQKAVLALVAACCFILPQAGAQNMEKGLHLIDMDQYHNASVAFKDLTKQNPANADMWYYLGYCYAQIGNADSAAIAFNAGLAADPKNPANMAGQAMVQHMKGQDVQAKATLLAASKLSQKKYPNGLVSIISSYTFCQYPVDEFIDGVYKKAQDLNMKNPNIYLKWGEILYNNKSYGDASLAYQRALIYDEKNVLAHYLLGQMYNAARNSTAALGELDAALELDPQFVPAIREKGDAYMALNKYDEAANWYAKYIAVTEETATSLTKYAEVLYFDKQYDKAFEIINKILKLEPNNPVMLRLMGYVSFETKKYDDGAKAMNKFFQIRKDTASNVTSRDLEYYAKLLKETNQDSLAIIYFQKTLAADSTHKIEYIESIGDLFLKQKKYIEANQYLEKSQSFRKGIDGKLQYKIGNNYVAAIKLLAPADSALKVQYVVKADSAFSKVCQSSPNVTVGYLSRARLYNLLDPDATKGLSKPYYQKTLEIALTKPEENKPVILESYQYLCSQLGYAFMAADAAKDKAKKAELKPQLMDMLQKMLAVDPGNKYALDNINSLNPPAKKPGAGAKR